MYKSYFRENVYKKLFEFEIPKTKKLSKEEISSIKKSSKERSDIKVYSFLVDKKKSDEKIKYSLVFKDVKSDYDEVLKEISFYVDSGMPYVDYSARGIGSDLSQLFSFIVYIVKEKEGYGLYTFSTGDRNTSDPVEKKDSRGRLYSALLKALGKKTKQTSIDGETKVYFEI